MPRIPSRPTEDPSVARVERLLSATAERQASASAAVESLLHAPYALWICACVALDDAPTWLIWESAAGTLFWSRDGDGGSLAVEHAQRAERVAGGHADPGGVLAWLEDRESTPWVGGDGWGDDAVIAHLAERLRQA